MSQIGYMVLAAGLGPAGYAFAIFHLLTHGFFKANMFLGAGSVMHAMDDDVDMRHYGGLGKLLPITSLTFGLGYLAIIGFPGFAGFFSKDRIIEAAFGENFFVGLAALIGAGVTAFYMTRLMAMTFFGERRWRPGVHPHESPLVMTLPLVVLGALSVGGGALIAGGWITDWLAPVVGHVPHEELAVPAWAMSLLITAVVAVGVAIGWTRYARPIPGESPQNVSLWVRAGRAELFGNDINDAIAVRPTKHLVRILVWLDTRVIDALVFGLADRLGDAATILRRPQTGFVRSYALSILGGAAVVLIGFLAVNFT
jgi:NADH-quinone oxidoreductase subunit L